MANGNLLNTLREMSAQSKINSDVAMPIAFQALAEIHDLIKEQSRETAVYRDNQTAELEAFREKITNHVEGFKADCDDRIQDNKDRIEQLEARKEIVIAIISAVGIISVAVIGFLT